MSDRENLLQNITTLLNEKALLEAQLISVNEAIEELRQFAYERAPKLAAEEISKQTAELREENQHLRQELVYIANANPNDFMVAGGFQKWAQSRARKAIEQEAGTLTVKKGNQNK